MSRHVVARGLVVIAVLCLAWSAFEVGYTSPPPAWSRLHPRRPAASLT